MNEIAGRIAAPMDFTGERMVPESADRDTFWEHIYRYRFASRFVRGKHVLDIACGEGYGSKGLQFNGAASVIGVDISPEACHHAHSKYGIDARVGCATSIPIPSNSVDLVVSFETIEHLQDAERFLRECVRVLRPTGTMIVSTPNKNVYNPNDNPQNNPFHVNELSETEFESLMGGRFSNRRIYVQSLKSAPRWSFASFASADSPWHDWRGYWRLQKIKHSAIDQREANARQDPVGEIGRAESALERIANPYSIWPRRRFGQYRSVYLICVASRTKKVRTM
jgi:ubiquinone/menaquinone biosynthesis C-methylase UbiE